MSVQVEKLEKNMAKLTIEVSAEDLEAALEAAFQKNKDKISVPGFRKGKVPRKMIEKMYGPSIFYEDAANALINEKYPEAYDECGEEIVSSPEIDVVQIEAGKPFIFTATVAIKPEVTLGEYKGIKVDKVAVEVTDEDVDAEIEKERKNSARKITVDDRAVAKDDIVTLDFEGFVDGVAFEGGKGEDYPLTIGSGAFIPGFEDQLIGAEIGQETEVKVTFPEDYHAEDLKGKEAVFKCTVKGIQVEQLPELDDDFASEVSTYDTLEEYKASVRGGLQAQKEDAAKKAKEEAVMAKIIENAQMDIPDAMVTSEQRQMLNDFAQRLQMQGLSMEQYMQFTGATPDALMAQIKPQALQRIQSRLVLEAIVKAENIEISDEEFEAEVTRMSEQYQMDAEQIKATLGETGKQQVIADMSVNKAADFVVENAVEE